MTVSHRIKSWLPALLVLMNAAVVSGEATSVAPDETVSVEAHEARRIVQKMKKTWYAHKTDVDENAGSYGLDCSAFGMLVLKKTNPHALKAIEKNFGKTRPLAVNFYITFEQAPANEDAVPWRRILRVADLRPGDYIAWRKSEIDPGETTGHVMIVDSIPIRDGDAYRLRVLDSTSRPHADDSRKDGADGLGSGTVWLLSDAAGAPTGLRSRSKDGKVLKVPLAMARAIAQR